MLEFEKCPLADGEIVSLSADHDALIVTWRDWREQVKTLRFGGLVGYQVFGPKSVPLSHGLVERDEALIALASDAVQETSLEGLLVYSFVSAWNDAKILRIIARSVADLPS